MSYIIRVAESSDVSMMRELEERCFDKTIRENFEFVVASDAHKYWVLEDESSKEIVGYAGVSISYEQGDILSICVDKNLRRKGFAVLLMTELINYVKLNKVQKLFLEVEETNESAINLYKKLGFELIYTRKNYYGDKSALIMVKEL